jgi:hypothetical protein
VIIFVIWFAFAGSKAMLIGPLTEEEDFVDPSHPSTIISNIMKNNFSASDDSYLGVQFVMGVKDINRTGENMWVADYVGTAIMDPDFNASCLRCQTFLLEFCDNLRK